METVYQSMRQQGLVRPAQGRVLGGVCPGSGGASASTRGRRGCCSFWCCLLIPGSQILVYPILWIIMPAEPVTVTPPSTVWASTTD